MFIVFKISKIWDKEENIKNIKQSVNKSNDIVIDNETYLQENTMSNVNNVNNFFVSKNTLSDFKQVILIENKHIINFIT